MLVVLSRSSCDVSSAGGQLRWYRTVFFFQVNYIRALSTGVSKCCNEYSVRVEHEYTGLNTLFNETEDWHLATSQHSPEVWFRLHLKKCGTIWISITPVTNQIACTHLWLLIVCCTPFLLVLSVWLTNHGLPFTVKHLPVASCATVSILTRRVLDADSETLPPSWGGYCRRQQSFTMNLDRCSVHIRCVSAPWQWQWTSAAGCQLWTYLDTVLWPVVRCGASTGTSPSLGKLRLAMPWWTVRPELESTVTTWMSSGRWTGTTVQYCTTCTVQFCTSSSATGRLAAGGALRLLTRGVTLRSLWRSSKCNGARQTTYSTPLTGRLPSDFS